MFRRILIANRGEIAARIARTCRRLGASPVGVASWADREALHTRAMDTVLPLGPSASSLSYLDPDRLLAAAQAAGAEALHPGYGFLSENAAFAEACEGAGIRWIGPAADAIRLMSDKDAARVRMQQAGVPVIPGFAVHSTTAARERCRALGYPVLVKAVAGGGGRGLRQVRTEGELEEALRSAEREAEAAFGNGRLLIEKWVTGARHIEIQVLADRHGRTVHLHERDCSLQRRHQKVIEEAPAPGLDAEVRTRLARSACEAAAAVRYANAGTVEFLLGADHAHYFIEMNTRLQVEHPVTECVTGMDLVEWQIRIAAGEPLGISQDEIQVRGHAIEARVCAEDPAHDFRPQPGPVREVQWPAGDGLRVDAGVASGDRVPPHYDSLVAKVVAWGDDREQARSRLAAALRRTWFAGPATNLPFLVACLDDAAFRSARFDTGFIPDRIDVLARPPEPPADEVFALAAAAIAAHASTGAAGDPWTTVDGWRGSGRDALSVPLHCTGRRVGALVTRTGASVTDSTWAVLIGRNRFPVAAAPDETGALRVGISGTGAMARAAVDDLRVWVGRDGHLWAVDRLDRTMGSRTGPGQAADFTSPMPGRVTDIQVDPGARVAAGTTLLIVEAMKIEHRITAPVDGRVKALLCEAGAWIAEGEALVDFVPDPR